MAVIVKEEIFPDKIVVTAKTANGDKAYSIGTKIRIPVYSEKTVNKSVTVRTITGYIDAPDMTIQQARAEISLLADQEK